MDYLSQQDLTLARELFFILYLMYDFSFYLITPRDKQKSQSTGLDQDEEDFQFFEDKKEESADRTRDTA